MELLCTLSSIELLNSINKLVDGVIVGDEYFANRINRHYSKEEIKKIKTKCHDLSLKLYVLINRMIEEDDLKDLYDYLLFLKELEVDGIYFNDLSVLTYANELNMTSLLSFNPDTLMTNYMDVKYYLDKGINSVVISKEITLEEILKIEEENKYKCDLIIHGRLNMSYTKRHFIKNYMNYLKKDYPGDDNLHLELVESTRSGKMPVLENSQGTSIFTEYTLASFKEVNEIKNYINHMIVDDIFMEEDELLDVLDGYRNVLNGMDGEIIYDNLKQKYPCSNYDTGYMYKKTNLVK